MRLKRQLEEDGREWQRLNRDAGALYRGAKLAQVTEWAAQHTGESMTLATAFLQASQTAAQRETEEEEAQRQKELAHAQALADTQRQRDHRNGCEPRIAAHRTESILHVAPELLEPRPCPGVARHFGDDAGIAELAPRVRLSLSR